MAGKRFLTGFGSALMPVPGSRRIYCRPCLDWSERRYHIAGHVGAEYAAAVSNAAGSCVSTGHALSALPPSVGAVSPGLRRGTARHALVPRALCGSHYTRKAKSFLSRSGIAARIEISGAPDVAFCFMRSLCRPANGNLPESAGACRHFRSCFSSERRRNVSTGAAVGLSAS